MRTSRLDLDDYNHEADEGLHITSMAGTWMAIVEGMAGIRVFSDKIVMNPVIPQHWDNYQFQLLVRNQPLEIRVEKKVCKISNKGIQDIEIKLFNENVLIHPGTTHSVTTTKTTD